ncbi:MAG: hypothetical protein ACI8RD_002745, partial [Bacillariaceae sp.]
KRETLTAVKNNRNTFENCVEVIITPA